ncbi:hypothetical protein COCSUDRAFT_42055 [Coccomyxa subellipsoidea C-169]|uniref:Uncharacterized protein n=1 Tax=Coccomyxa subellipsoidea (strain C-169) TaxID=574566 RepID=I0YXI1_COCSC|nr:hypothetical protein COCSUDRAFT_42055 [Coccomyxa subellipsoidea C-169]EIE23100.1 hypothetical protein COCSUDRAFT_42055 [Coccomyxa subellipsoidea C-169]|eukprot:XP_005647644.1 hypothetical protein COCSUDRAFT_42055 [Coccomyxa subellipsoidea C-169]
MFKWAVISNCLQEHASSACWLREHQQPQQNTVEGAAEKLGRKHLNKLHQAGMLMETDHEDEDRGDPSPLLKAAKRIWMRKRSKWKKSGTQLKVAALLVEMDFPNELEYPTTD